MLSENENPTVDVSALRDDLRGFIKAAGQFQEDPEARRHLLQGLREIEPNLRLEGSVALSQLQELISISLMEV